MFGVLGGVLTGCGNDASTSSPPPPAKSATTKVFTLTGHVFSDKNFGFNFTYPKDWSERDPEVDAAQSTGGKPVARAAVGLDNDNAILLLRNDLSQAVAAADLPGHVSELDGIVGQLSGQQSSGTVTEIGGLPAVRYEEVALRDDTGGRNSRIVFLFDGHTEYELNCQSNAEGRNKINQGCDRALATLRKK